MSSLRFGLLATVVAGVVALSMSWQGTEVDRSLTLVPAAVPAGGQSDAVSSTWFCAAGSAGTPQPTRHGLTLFNPAGTAATARLTAHGTEGVVGEETVEVPAPGPLSLDVRELFGAEPVSVMVESEAPELVVEHRLFDESSADQVPCATSSSDTWYFPAQSTLRGTASQLVLFNPFSADASVDISAAVDDGIRVPPEWQGLVVEAGSTRTIDLGAKIQRRELFSLVVRSRNGRVVAETTEYLDTEADPEAERPATHGLRMQVGVPTPQIDWSFAEGFTGEGVRERLVLFNPAQRPAGALVQVTPYGAPELAPEPFQVEIPARRYTVIDLSGESRIPGEGFHSIQVQSDEQTPVVVGRVVDIIGETNVESSPEVPARPPLDAGTAIGTGTPVAAPLWAATGLTVDDSVPQQSSVFVHNPGTGAVVVSASVLGGEADGTVLAEGVEVAAGDGLVLSTADKELGTEPVTVIVEASSPVVVERTVTFMRQDDLAMGLAVPLRSARSVLSPLAAG